MQTVYVCVEKSIFNKGLSLSASQMIKDATV